MLGAMSIFWTMFWVAFFKAIVMQVVAILIATSRLIRERVRDRSGQSEATIRKLQARNEVAKVAKCVRAARQNRSG